MKKVLMLIVVVAVFSGTAFATTTPVFSGEFKMSTTVFSSDDTQGGYYKLGGKHNVSVALGATVSEWASVDAKLKIAEPDVEDGQNLAVKINSFKLKTDITGALGLSAPVGLVIHWGKVGFKTSEHGTFADWIDFTRSKETRSYWGMGIDLIFVEKVTLRTLVLPTTYLTAENRVVRGNNKARVSQVHDDNYMPVWYFELMLNDLVPGLKTSLAYASDPQKEASEKELFKPTGEIVAVKEKSIEPINHIVLAVGYETGPISIGFSATYSLLDAEESNGHYKYKPNGYYMDKSWFDKNHGLGIGLTATYKAGTFLTAGIAFAGQNIMNKFTDYGKVGVSVVAHVVPDVLDIYVASTVPFMEMSDNFAVEGGLEAKLAGVTYTLGYDYRNASYKSPNGAGMYFQVAAKF